MGYIATLYRVTKDVSSHLPLGEMTENSSLHSLRGAWPCCPGPRMPISAISGNYIVAIGEELSIQRGVTLEGQCLSPTGLGGSQLIPQ